MKRPVRYYTVHYRTKTSKGKSYSRSMSAYAPSPKKAEQDCLAIFPNAIIIKTYYVGKLNRETDRFEYSKEYTKKIINNFES